MVEVLELSRSAQLMRCRVLCMSSLVLVVRVELEVMLRSVQPVEPAGIVLWQRTTQILLSLAS